MVIETERLLLREMTYDDFQPLYEVLADSEIMQHYRFFRRLWFNCNSYSEQ